MLWLKILLMVILDAIDGYDGSVFYRIIVCPVLGILVWLLFPMILVCLVVLPWGLVELLFEIVM